MEAGIPTVGEVREMHPAELAVVLSTLELDGVLALDRDGCESVVVATQKVASWLHALQSATVDRFAELTADDLEVHVAGLEAEREARRAAGQPVVKHVPVPEPDAIAASSLAPLLNLAPRTMRTRLNRARLLMELPATLDHAMTGRLEPWRVDGVVTAAGDVSWERLGEFEARLYATDVSRLPKPRLVDRARRAAAKADPDGNAVAHDRGPRRRGLRWQPSDIPGLMRWTADLPDQTSRELAAAVDSLAAEYLAADALSGTLHHGVRRTVEAARLDALADLAMRNVRVETVVELVLPPTSAAVPVAVERPARTDVIRDALSAGRTRRPGRAEPGCRAALAPSDAEGEPFRVLVDLVAGHVTRATLDAGDLERATGQLLGEHLEIEGNPFLTTDRCRGRTPAPPGPGAPPSPRDVGDPVWFVDGLVEVPGTSGLLPPQVVALLSNPDTRIRVTDLAAPAAADNTPRRRRTYRPGKEVAARVRARDGHCRFPGCSVPAKRCDLDHVVRYPLGDTVETNLMALCRTHHGFKHHAGWTVTLHADGSCAWTAPTGRSHVTHPATRRDTAA